MSEIITDKLTGKTAAGDVTITSEGGSSTMQLQQGVAKAWANLNGDGSGAPIRNSLNVASTTDIGTGRYTLNFSNSFATADFACTAGCGETATTTTNFFCNPCNVSVGEVTLVIYSASASLNDRDNVHGMVQGDLA